jgi:hypothetical protein
MARISIIVAFACKKLAASGIIRQRNTKQIEALTAAVRKVSDQIALDKPATQLVANP